MPEGTSMRFRSRLNEIPLDAKIKIGEIPFQKGMLASHRKKMAIDILKEYNIPFTELGTGTNRFIVKYDGYALKIALDREGIADNKQEWVMSDMLNPDVAYSHEISSGGHLLVATYAAAFTSYAEMYTYSTSIKKILERWGQRYLLGDVGISRVNYANWGLLPEGRPVCIDYAYIFPASFELFKCICGNKSMTLDGNFSEYKCTECGHRYQDRELRAKISQQERMKLFSSASGITMVNEYENHEVDPKYIKYERKPDDPDPYDVAMTVTDHLNGHDTESWYK